jgi:CelD/BcsL family acetyltransferase involved in cellulose biosynthesis
MVAPVGAEGFDAVAAAAHPSHDFLRWAWFEAAAPGRIQAIAAHRDGGGPIAAIPFLPAGRFSPARIPGSYWPYRSFPVAADVTSAQMTAMLAHSSLRSALGRVWRLGPVFADDPTAARLIEAAPAGGWTALVRSLGTSFELNLATLQPKGATLRKNRARERALEEIGPVEWRFFSGEEWTAADRDAIAAVEANSWLAGLGSGADTKFLDPECRRIWERAAADPAIARMLRCSLLTVGDAPVAFTFGLEVGKVRYMIANNYDGRFAKCGPGKLLLYRDFAAAAERGIARIGWGAGDPGYKSEMGAAPGPEILDLLFVRGTALAALLRPFWSRPHRS